MTSSPQPALTVGGYTLLSRLGEGGMGVVHLAQRPGGDRVALKVLRPHIVGDDEARQRLAREVSSLSRIRSRYVAEIVDSDPWGEIPFVATRYVPGLSLHDDVQEEGPIEGDDLYWFAEKLAEGLESVHEVGVLHRDVKPSNVLMEGRTPILIDFGLARVADDPKLTHTGWLLGTPGYLAPEILYGDDATEASDVHAWAATVAYAGTGRPPFGRGPSMAIMDRVRRGQHDLSGLPAQLRAVVDAALDPDPLRRPSLDELLDWFANPTAPPVDALAHPDPWTVPLAMASQARERTISLFDDDTDGTGTRLLEEDIPSPVVGLAERMRRGLLLLSLLAVVGTGSAAYPWVTLAVVAVLTWLFRAGSLAATAAGNRRLLRGNRWYDAPQLLLASPWHVVQAIPGALLLLLWAFGLGIAGALICYAVHATLVVTLLVSGVVLGLALWLGPGGSRFRGPTSRLVNPIARPSLVWFAVWLLATGAAVGLGLLATQHGIDWLPAGAAPFK